MPTKDVGKQRISARPPQSQARLRAAAGWAEHLRSAAVRLNSGGSGIIRLRLRADHDEPSHRGRDSLETEHQRAQLLPRRLLRTPTKKKQALPDLELNVLIAIEDVTRRVNQGLTPGTEAAKAAEARRKATAAIEKEATEKRPTSTTSSLIRWPVPSVYISTLMFAWSSRLSSTSRFSAAIRTTSSTPVRPGRAVFRAYEDGKPAKVEHYLRLKAAGTNGATWFSSPDTRHGPTGSTPSQVSNTCGDVELLEIGHARIARSVSAGIHRRSPEALRQSKDELYTIQNSRKARVGGWQAYATRHSWPERLTRL